MNLTLGMASGAERAKASPSPVIQNALGQNAPRRIAGTQKQYVINGVCHVWPWAASSPPADSVSCGFPLARWDRQGCAALSAAAVFRQEAQQRVHLFIVSRVVDEAARLSGLDQVGVTQRFQVKGQCIRRNTQPCRDLRGGDPIRACLNEDAVNLESAVLREGSQSGHRSL